MNPNPIPDGFGAKVSIELAEKTARELIHLAAISIPEDFRVGVTEMAAQETYPLSKYVLDEICCNYEAAVEDQRPMCGDTGLPRYYIKAGNECSVEGGFTALERSLRKATADATREIPLRPNRVHPLTRKAFWDTTVLGRSTGNVAVAVDIRPAAVRKANSRTLQRLRKRLGDRQ